jgi:hypothetical protein
MPTFFFADDADLHYNSSRHLIHHVQQPKNKEVVILVVESMANTMHYYNLFHYRPLNQTSLYYY